MPPYHEGDICRHLLYHILTNPPGVCVHMCVRVCISIGVCECVCAGYWNESDICARPLRDFRARTD